MSDAMSLTKDAEFKERSEHGKGLFYCIGLFLKHAHIPTFEDQPFSELVRSTILPSGSSYTLSGTPPLTESGTPPISDYLTPEETEFMRRHQQEFSREDIMFSGTAPFIRNPYAISVKQWFMDASHHLVEMDITGAPNRLRHLFEELKDKVLDFAHEAEDRHSIYPNERDKQGVIDEAISILYNYDAYLPVDVIRADFT